MAAVAVEVVVLVVLVVLEYDPGRGGENALQPFSKITLGRIDSP